MDEIHYRSATELAGAIERRELSAVEVVEAHLGRIARYNSALNAIVTLDEEGARRRARQADEALARGEYWGPLHGVPFTLKDCHATAGMRTTAGFLPLADYVPREDGVVAARLKKAGGILLGKTNVPVMMGDIQSFNPIFGRSNNPWNLARTPGGSSGGASAALAAGFTPLEVGSDIGGSIRIPAAFCGLLGLKTTEHRVSQAGHIPPPPGDPPAARVMAVIGPMARTINDAAIEAVAAALAPLCQVVAECLPELDFEGQRLRYSTLAGMILSAFGPPEPGTAPAALADYLSALGERDQAILVWERFFAEWDVLLCPVAMTAAFPHCETDAPLTVDGRTVEYWLGNSHCKVFNHTGHPAIALPYTLDSDGLPVGLQLVARRWGDERLLAIASAVSQVTGGFRRPPGY